MAFPVERSTGGIRWLGIELNIKEMKTSSHLYDGGVHQKLVQVEPAMMLSQQVLWTRTQRGSCNWVA
ncbi:hypothetical protein AZE42_14048 [Rhizopogon vesiculosus]|uniref:Uncharacterized protein n=1 Tax=Rhizopogon vesiculosus TaxID=180088 RepID=A0A1J8R0G0_9AGAM|nr:hypothetical protein AZE42_14048 [Rhizopogon vesiculosus]